MTLAFQSPRGIIDVEVRSRFSVNDRQVPHATARKGLGIATIARVITQIAAPKSRAMDPNDSYGQIMDEIFPPHQLS
jgi:hypothetical protein